MEKLRVLMLGDVVGQAGCRTLFFHLKRLIKEYRIDFTIVNGENANEGFGILPEDAEAFFSAGVNVITSGNHIWQKREILEYMKRESRILRPDNYPPGIEGTGVYLSQTKGIPLMIINLQGRQRMGAITDCPFRSLKKILTEKKKEFQIVIVDFHAEDAQEKEALALKYDGKISLLAGTHTHVQTADERILPKGTAYITDLGMIGPKNSVIGARREVSLQRSLTQMPLQMEVEIDGPTLLSGIVCEIDVQSGNALRINRIREVYP